MQFPRAGAESFSEDRPLGWDPVARGGGRVFLGARPGGVAPCGGWLLGGRWNGPFRVRGESSRNTPEYNFNKRYTMEPITVNYKVLDPRAKVPAYATPGAAAADLCAVLDEPLTLAPMQRALVPTGLAIELPGPHAVALVYARSGLSIKHGLCMANGVGVVDSDYRGELKVPMINLGTEAYTIQPGERVAQLCIAPVYTAAFAQAAELGDTQRGAGGFGSTGK